MMNFVCVFSNLKSHLNNDDDDDDYDELVFSEMNADASQKKMKFMNVKKSGFSSIIPINTNLDVFIRLNFGFSKLI